MSLKVKSIVGVETHESATRQVPLQEAGPALLEQPPQRPGGLQGGAAGCGAHGPGVHEDRGGGGDGPARLPPYTAHSPVS